MTNEPTELLPEVPEPCGEVCDAIATLTDEELSLGNQMGETIDPEDDDQNGVPESRIASFAAVTTDRDKAYAKARALKKTMLDHGVPEVSIELLPGRPSDYGVWDSLFVVSEFSHHTVSRYSATSRTPVLALCKNGRSDLPGPLCNGYGGWDLCYRIITFGYGNHPGEGGPFVVPALTAGSFTIPKDSARRYAWGTEWEGGLNEADWDKVLTNPRNGKKMTFREFMGRSNAALEAFLEIHEQAHLEHSTWTSRKIDRLNYTRQKGIAEKAPFRKKPPVVERPDGTKMPTVGLESMQKQFRAFLGMEGSARPEKRAGVKVIQKALNKRYKAGLKVTGVVDQATADAWAKHEQKIGVIDRPRVPDLATLTNLGRRNFKVKS